MKRREIIASIFLADGEIDYSLPPDEAVPLPGKLKGLSRGLSRSFSTNNRRISTSLLFCRVRLHSLQNFCWQSWFLSCLEALFCLRAVTAPAVRILCFASFWPSEQGCRFRLQFSRDRHTDSQRSRVDSGSTTREHNTDSKSG